MVAGVRGGDVHRGSRAVLGIGSAICKSRSAAASGNSGWRWQQQVVARGTQAVLPCLVQPVSEGYRAAWGVWCWRRRACFVKEGRRGRAHGHFQSGNAAVGPSLCNPCTVARGRIHGQMPRFTSSERTLEAFAEWLSLEQKQGGSAVAKSLTQGQGCASPIPSLPALGQDWC